MELEKYKEINIAFGDTNGEVLVVTDATGIETWEAGSVMPPQHVELFKKHLEASGYTMEQCNFINPCPPMPASFASSEKKKADWLAQWKGMFMAQFSSMLEDAKLVVTLGPIALRQISGRAVQINKQRGKLTNYDSCGDVPVLPLVSPATVLRFPVHTDLFSSDINQIGTLAEADWDEDIFEDATSTARYEWCTDLQFLIDDPPQALCIDTETIGLGRDVPVLIVQLTPRPGVSYIVPVHCEYFNNPDMRSEETNKFPLMTQQDRTNIIEQLRTIMGNPDTACVGHNFKYDIHVMRNNLGIEVAHWHSDTLQLAFAADENMLQKSLDDCVRRWLPEYAGYADKFNATHDKSRMDLVPHEAMTSYGGGDTDACYRLAQKLTKIVKKDARQWNVYKKVMMPVVRTFIAMEEFGINVDTDGLREFAIALELRERELYARMIEQVPPEVLRAHEQKGLKFSRAEFIVDTLFGKHGIIDPDTGERLKPLVYTPGTRKLPYKERIPSTSAKDHLPYFQHIPFVSDLMEYSKVAKMRSTYVGQESHTIQKRLKRLKNGGLPKKVSTILDAAGYVEGYAPKAGEIVEFGSTGGSLVFGRRGAIIHEIPQQQTGFWNYLDAADVIHPSFNINTAVTGRASSRNPNGQNLPKRGPLAKAYRKIFKPRPGFVLIECDLSQAELRIAAWMARDEGMLKIYRNNGDIHSATAAATLRVPLEMFNRWMADSNEGSAAQLANRPQAPAGLSNWIMAQGRAERSKLTMAAFCGFKRFQAKAVNFGFLYGMGAKKFREYARTDYNIEYTEEEAYATRDAFFAAYPGLQHWHEQMRSFTRKHQYVRSLHGALRRLDNVLSIDEMVQGGTERQGINSPVQRFASDLGLIGMQRFGRDCDWNVMRPLLFIHDAVIVEAREEQAEEAAGAIRWYMESTPLQEWFDIEPLVPIVADVSMGPNLGEMEERPDIEALKPEWAQSDEVFETCAVNPLVAPHKRRRGITL